MGAVEVPASVEGVSHRAMLMSTESVSIPGLNSLFSIGSTST